MSNILGKYNTCLPTTVDDHYAADKNSVIVRYLPLVCSCGTCMR